MPFVSVTGTVRSFVMPPGPSTQVAVATSTPSVTSEVTATSSSVTATTSPKHRLCHTAEAAEQRLSNEAIATIVLSVCLAAALFVIARVIRKYGFRGVWEAIRGERREPVPQRQPVPLKQPLSLEAAVRGAVMGHLETVDSHA